MSSAPQDQLTELLDVPKDFLKEGTQFINRMSRAFEKVRWPLLLTVDRLHKA